MKLSENFSYSGASVDAVFALLSDQAFRTESCAQQGATDYEVTVEQVGDGAHVTIVRTQAADMPDFVKKLTGSTVKVKQTEQWSGPDADGNRTADVKVSIIGQPAEMTGSARLFAQGDGAEFTVDGDVKVAIPFIGKKIEPEVAKAIRASLREEVEYGMTKL
jgi:single-stranded DNA-binding protein